MLKKERISLLQQLDQKEKALQKEVETAAEIFAEEERKSSSRMKRLQSLKQALKETEEELKASQDQVQTLSVRVDERVFVSVGHM